MAILAAPPKPVNHSSTPSTPPTLSVPLRIERGAAGDGTRPEWGPWRYERQNLTLVLREESCRYEVDLERCTSSAETLDWIMQVASKTWATPEGIAGLVHALRDLLQPQATLCSFGVERGLLNITRQLQTWPQRCAERRALRELQRLRPGPISMRELCDPIAAVAKVRGGSHDGEL